MKNKGRFSSSLDRRAASRPDRWAARLRGDVRGAVIVEVALSLPILLMFLIGIIAYGAWLSVANMVQQAANEAARAAIAGITTNERQLLAAESVTKSFSRSTMLDPALVSVSTTQTGAFYVVSVSYDAAHSPLFSASPVPLPKGAIKRESVVKLASM
jgi:Flp pilus assembly protein TadG